MYIAPARHWGRCPRSDLADGARSLCRGSCAVFDAAMSEALPERRGLRASVVHAPVPPPEAPGGGDSHRRVPGAKWRAREEWADFDACRPARAGRFVHPSLVSSLHPSPSSSPSGLLLASLPFRSLSPLLYTTAMTADDKRNQKGIENYAAFWDKDSKNDTQAHTENRLNAYTDVVNGYYDGATELYEYGWGTSFHFSRFFKGEGFTASLARHEYYLAAQMSLRPGQKVLDVGCGVGGPARAIARFSDANIIGVNNNDYQLEKARKYTQQQDLQDQVSFQKGDFMSLSKQFGENSFDAVYAIEATVHAPSFEGIYSEIYKVLKPGGTVGIYEWVMTDEWDPTNPEHKDIAHGIEIGDGIAEMRNAKNAHEAFVAAGFEIIVEEDLAARPDAIPWYYPLEGDLRKAQTVYDLLTCFRTSKVGQMITHNVTWGAEKLGLVPKGTYSVGETLRVAGDALVRGGQKKLFTPMYLFIGRKPLDAK